MMGKLLRSILVLSVGFCLTVPTVWAQQTITGKVTDASSGTPLPGVNISVVGTSTGTATNAQGEYSLEVPEGAQQLRFSFIGYKTKVISINGRTTINITLQSKEVALSELVVTALGVEQQKKSLSYTVEQVDGEALSNVPLTNPINSLSGRVAGLNITPNTSGPGSPSRVIIRGSTSLTGNNQPLYVIDGVPISNVTFGNGTLKSEYSQGNYGSSISVINPENIKSITVLKGPSAAALYGSRAANGVIMITTKKGYERKGIGVSYSGSFTWKTPMVLPDYQNQYGQGTNGQIYTDVEALNQTASSWGARFDGKKHMYYTGEPRPYVAQPNNVSNFFRTAGTFNNTLALMGGSENATFRFSYTHTKAQSILPNSGLKGHHFNVRATASLSDRLKVDAKITYATQEVDHRPIQGTEGIMATVYDMPRNVRLADLKNYQNPDYSVRTYGPSTSGNPYWILFHDTNRSSKKRLLGFVKVIYDFTSHISAFARVGTDVTKQHTKSLTNYGHWFFPRGRFTINNYTATETNADFLIMYDNTLFDKFGVHLKVGGNHRYTTRRQAGVFAENFKVPTATTLASASFTDPSNTPMVETKMNSLYATASFSYNNTFYLNLSGRNDWTSTLAPGNWSYFYPSIGASVLVNEFIDPSGKVVDLLKIRASWAQVGNDTGPYQLKNTYSLVSSATSYLGRTMMTIPPLLLSKDLRPEKVSSWEIGTNFELFNNRLYGSFTYYHIKSEDLIIDVPLPSGTSYSEFRTNVGQITNTGIEISLGGTPILTKNMSWDISLNFAQNENKLVELTEGLEKFTFSTSNSGNIAVRATVGGGFGEIWGTTYRRTNDGRLILDATGRPQATPNRVLLGNYQPDFSGGLSNSFRYKNLSLSVLIDATFGGEVYVATQSFLDAAGVSKKTLKYRENGVVVEGVINTGTAENPNYVENTNQINAQQYWGAYSGIASNYVKEQTNIRLREVSLSYSLPSSIMAKTPLTNVTISLIGRNLFFIYSKIDNYDPATSYSSNQYAQGVMYFNLPTTTQFGFSIDLKF